MSTLSQQDLQELIKYYAKREEERDNLWLKVINLDKFLYELYLKHPTCLTTIRELQEEFNRYKEIINQKDLELKKMAEKRVIFYNPEALRVWPLK